jgi:twitching motility protein PilT
MNPVATLVSGASAEALSPVIAQHSQPNFLFQSSTLGAEDQKQIARLHAILAECKRRSASDVHLTGGIHTYFRIDNDVVPYGDPLSPTDVESIALALMTSQQRQVFLEKQQIDLAFFTPDDTRYRANAYRQRGSVALALRRLDEDFRSFNDLNLPPQLEELANFPFGLVVVTGATGSGKSTTLATILHQINVSRACHVITIEDPIEHVHSNKKSLFHQRELHCDVPDFATALKAALREDPDVLLVGEMRDLETVRAAITAAETGHLVFSTLHTGDCVGSISRMVGSFPADEQPMVRDQLSRVLRAVVSQRLVRHKTGKGRVPVVEIMRVNAALSNLIRVGDMRQALTAIQAGADEGMLLLEQSLACLAAANLIALEEARLWARDVSVLESRYKTLTQRGWGR